VGKITLRQCWRCGVFLTPNTGQKETRLAGRVIARQGAARDYALFDAGGRAPVAHGLGARRGLCLVLEQLQQPLSASPRQLPCGQASPWGAGAGLVGGCSVRVRGKWLSDRAHLCSEGVGLFLALHVIALQHMHDPAQCVARRATRHSPHDELSLDCSIGFALTSACGIVRDGAHAVVMSSIMVNRMLVP
jgi:hypothetical protein